MSEFPTWAELKAQGLKFWAELQKARADGKISFVEVLGLIVTLCESLMVVAEQVDATGGAKEQWVLDTAYEAYKADFDIDIPYVPGFLERPFEKAIFKGLLPKLIDTICKASKGGIVNKPPGSTVEGQVS